MFRDRKGFTLIELLVVIGIIGLLSTIVMVAVQTSRTTSKKAAMGKAVDQYIYAIKSYQTEYGALPYPSDIPLRSVGALQTCLGNFADDTCGSTSSPIPESAVLNSLLSPYHPSLPYLELVPSGGGSSFRGPTYNCGSSNPSVPSCEDVTVVWFTPGSGTRCYVSGANGTNMGILTYCSVTIR